MRMDILLPWIPRASVKASCKNTLSTFLGHNTHKMVKLENSYNWIKQSKNEPHITCDLLNYVDRETICHVPQDVCLIIYSNHIPIPVQFTKNVCSSTALLSCTISWSKLYQSSLHFACKQKLQKLVIPPLHRAVSFLPPFSYQKGQDVQWSPKENLFGSPKLRESYFFVTAPVILVPTLKHEKRHIILGDFKGELQPSCMSTEPPACLPCFHVHLIAISGQPVSKFVPSSETNDNQRQSRVVERKHNGSIYNAFTETLHSSVEKIALMYYLTTIG